MRKTLAFLCIFLTFSLGFSKSSLYSMPPEPFSEASMIADNEGICQYCSQPQADCVCYYAMPGCYPSAPVCGTSCGISYLSMAIAIGLVVGVAALILSSPFHVHSATPRR